MKEGFFSTVYRISERVMRLGYVNLLWILFTIVGLGILGIFPATAAMFAVIRQKIKNEKTITIKLYYTYFKQNFWKANLSGWIIALIGYLFYLNINLVSLLEGNVAVVLFFVLIFLAVIYLLLACYFFPVYVHYDLKIRNYFALSIIYVFSRPTHTILIGVVSILNVYLIYYVPALIPFLGVSLWAFFVTHISQNAFHKADSSGNA